MLYAGRMATSSGMLAARLINAALWSTRALAALDHIKLTWIPLTCFWQSTSRLRRLPQASLRDRRRSARPAGKSNRDGSPDSRDCTCNERDLVMEHNYLLHCCTKPRVALHSTTSFSFKIYLYHN